MLRKNQKSNLKIDDVIKVNNVAFVNNKCHGKKINIVHFCAKT